MRWAIVCLLVGFASAAEPPRIWDEPALRDWATPIAAIGIRPGHYTSEQYYAVPADNLKTYPLYRPDREPPGYWEWLQKQKPQPLVDKSAIRTPADWISAGEKAFREIDSITFRSNDPKVIATARDPKEWKNFLVLPDGSAIDRRWVVTARGVEVTQAECTVCHFLAQPHGVLLAGPAGTFPPAGYDGLSPAGINTLRTGWGTMFPGDDFKTLVWRMWTVPWDPDPRVERIRDEIPANLNELFGIFDGGFARFNGTPYGMSKIPDLHTLRYSKYIDASATHRLRGPEDLARYLALVTGADSFTFGSYRILTESQSRVAPRHADEVLYAISMYLLSLEPLKNPDVAPPPVLERGRRVFISEGCINCHVPPAYTSGKLTLAAGYQAPADHPYGEDILRVSVGTDPELALKTRKGTGLYRIPSLRGVWYRPRLLHDGSAASLEEMFDPARLRSDHIPGGWKGPGIKQRAIPGHRFGLDLKREEKEYLLAFLRSL